MSALDQVEALLEEGRAHAAAEKAANGDSSPRKRSVSPSSRSHASSRSHRKSRRDHSSAPRGERRERSRSSRKSDRDRDDPDRRSNHSGSSKRERDDDRDRDRDRDRKRHRSSRSTSRDKDRARDRESDTDGRRDRGERDEYRSPRDARRRDEYRGSGNRHRDDSRDRRRSSRDSPRYDDKPARATEAAEVEKRQRSPSPNRMTEEEHEMRSVFVSQLSARVGDRELFQFFETQVGKVRDARVILDRVSRRSKGVAYVEFFELDDVRKAINLTGTKLLGVPIIVQYTEAERNRQAGMQQPTNVPEHITIPPGSDARGDTSVPWNRIYVGSLPFSLRENDIRSIFEPFGSIDVVDLHFDNITMKSKGYCFVQFRKHVDAQQALEKMNGFEIAGRPIRVGLVTEKGSANPNQMVKSTGSGMLRPDSLEEGGGSLNNTSRYELMQKLARNEPSATSIPNKPMFRVNVPTAVSKSVLLKNMFDPAEETERDWDVELRADVKDECESKYGPVTEIYLERDSAGEIYVRFSDIQYATKAIQGLNGRWFGGKQISAAYISDAMFDVHRK